MEDVIQQVKNMKDHGASNREIAEFITRVVDRRITNANSVEGSWSRGIISYAIDYYSSGYFVLTEGLEKDKKYMKERENLGGRKTPGKEYADRAQWAWDLKYGACNEISNITYHILKEAGIKDAKILEIPGHNFTVFGLDPGAKVSDPRTWGKDAVVADGWQGKTYNSDSAFTNKYIGDKGNKQPLDVTTTYDNPKLGEILARRLKLCADLALQAELEVDSGDPQTAQQAVQEFKRNQCPGMKDVAPLRAGLEDQIKKLMMNPKDEGEKESGEEEIEDWPEDDQKAEELAKEFANAGETGNDDYPDDTVETWPEDDDEPEETTAATQTPPLV